MPWASVRENVRLPLKLSHAGGRGRQPHRRGAGAGRPCRICRCLPRELSGGMKMRVSLARALVTDRIFCCWTSRSRRSTRSRAFGSTTICLICGASCTRPSSSSPFGVRVGLPVAAGDRDDGAAGPHRQRISHRDAGAAQRGVSHLGRIRRLLPRGLDALAPSYSGQRMRTWVALRLNSQRRMLRACSLCSRRASAYGNFGARQRHPALRAAEPSRVSRRSSATGRCCRNRSASRCSPRWKALSPRPSAASRWRCCSISRNGWNIRCFPMR